MFSLTATKNILSLTQSETITSGSVNAYQCSFAFDPDWDGLTKTAVFVGSGTSISILLDSTNQVTIPWETIQYYGGPLIVGVYGTANDAVVLPTIWCTLGIIQAGTDLGEDAANPTPSVYVQILTSIGNLDELDTEAKNSLVAAINEIYSSSGGGGGGGNIASPDINQILVMDQGVYDTLPEKSNTTLYLIRG